MWWTLPRLEIVFVLARETQRNCGIPSVMVTKSLAASRWYTVDAVTTSAAMLEVNCSCVDIRTDWKAVKGCKDPL